MSAVLEGVNYEGQFRLMIEDDLDNVIAIEESVYPFLGLMEYSTTV